VVRHPIVREKYGLLPEAAESAASPQIRNQGTIGGNVSQDARCWYYRGGLAMLPGRRQTFAMADTTDGPQTVSTPFSTRIAASQSIRPIPRLPLIALDAKMVIRSPKGERVVNAEDYFIGPGIDITPHDNPEARRSAHLYSYPVNVGRCEILF